MNTIKQNYILNIGLYIILFYITISTNFIGELYNPELIYLLQNNYYIKHILGYITLLTFIIFSDTSSDNLIYDLKLSFITYILFVMSTKINSYYFLLCILCIFTAFMLDKINKLYIKDKQKKKQIVLLYNFLGIFGTLLIVFGFPLEYSKQKNKYGNDFSLNKFIFRKI